MSYANMYGHSCIKIHFILRLCSDWVLGTGGIVLAPSLNTTLPIEIKHSAQETSRGSPHCAQHVLGTSMNIGHALVPGTHAALILVLWQT